MKIVRLLANNIKRLTAIEIKPDGSVIQITGKNGAGKSSVLDTIAYGLGGTRLIPDKPIKDGEKKANVEIDLGDYTVIRTWKLTDDNQINSYLKVKNKEGATFSSPQVLLDKLVGDLAFDPLEFSRMEQKPQRELLLKVAGVDLEALDEERKQVYDDRSDINRQVKNKSGELAGMDKPETDTPKEEVSVSQLTRNHQDAVLQRNANDTIREAHDEQKSGIKSLESDIQDLKDALAQKEVELKTAEKIEKEMRREAENIIDPDLESIQKQISTAEETNRAVRAAKSYFMVKAGLTGLKKQSETMTKKIEAIDQQKADVLKAASFPVPGLSVNEDGVTLNDLPFNQACSSEQLKVSVAMAMALNPKLRIIRIMDGSLLDAESMAVLEKMTKDKDFQVWIERVNDTGEVGIVIEDGKIAN
jgi:DNA repair exonuclease SbcCD ATPase subunit